MAYKEYLDRAKDLAAKNRGFNNWGEISNNYFNPNYPTQMKLDLMGDIAHYYNQLLMAEFLESLKPNINAIMNDVKRSFIDSIYSVLVAFITWYREGKNCDKFYNSGRIVSKQEFDVTLASYDKK